MDYLMKLKKKSYNQLVTRDINTMNNKLIFTISDEDGHYDVTVGSTYCGTLERDIDGFYYYLPVPYKDGYYTADFLLIVGNKLKEINDPWEQELIEALKVVPDVSLFDSP